MKDVALAASIRYFILISTSYLVTRKNFLVHSNFCLHLEFFLSPFLKLW